MRLVWIKYSLFIWLLNSINPCFSDVSDEDYAMMPNVFETDDYDSCMLLKDKALYCAVEYTLVPLNAENPPKVWKAIEEYSESDLHYRHDVLRRFICLSKKCPNIKIYNQTDVNFQKELNDCFDNNFKSEGFRGSLKVIKCKGAGPIYEIDRLDWIVAALFFAYIGMVLLLTLYDYVKSCDVEKYQVFKGTFGGKFATSFSVVSNWKKLNSIPVGSEYDRLRPVQGLRVYMSIMVIIIHTVLTQVAVPVSNTKYFEDVNDNPDVISSIPKRAVFMLSFHFMMSSWILMLSLLAKNDRGEPMNITFLIKSIIKRYVRFILTIAVVVGFYATWYRHIPFGPFFEGVCDESERCRKNWWTNLLFIQNHYDRYFMCHIISWYLAVDMQYYIIALFLLLIVFKRKMNIPIVVGTLLVINFIFTVLDHKRHNYPSSLSGRPEEMYRLLFNRKPQWHDHFASYHGNAAGYIAGLGFGYIFYRCKNQKIFTNLLSKGAWIIFSMGLLTLSMILPQIYDVDQTPTHSAIWVALTRPLFSIGMGILILGFSEGLGGIQVYEIGYGNNTSIEETILRTLSQISQHFPLKCRCLIEKIVLRALRIINRIIPLNILLFYTTRTISDTQGTLKTFLNWNPLYVLGKLSYCVYICHTIFQNVRVGIMRSPAYMSYYSLVVAAASDILLSFLGALFLSLFFEMPSNELANNMFKEKKKIEQKKTN